MLPIRAALFPISPSSFRFSAYWANGTTNISFTADSTDQRLLYQSNIDCLFPSFLNKIRWAMVTGDLKLYPSIAHYVQHLSDGASPAKSNPLISTFRFDNNPLLSLKRKQFQRMILGNLTASNTDPLPFISAKQWLDFVNAPIKPTVRNVCYKLIHCKLSSQARLCHLVGDIDDDRCRVCQEIKSDEHILFTCEGKLAVWSSSFSRYLNNPFVAERMYLKLPDLQLSHLNIQ